MKESFVFHLEYIDDLPQEYKGKFTQYTVEYGLYGKNPPIQKETLEYSLWVKIARRIDAESSKYQEVSERRKEAAKKRYEKYNAEKTENQTNQEEKPKRKKFEKPTVEEVAEYCKERKNEINANAFYDFYESKDWKVGNQKMKDWKACIRTWENRKKTENSGGHVKGLIGNEKEVSEDYLDF